MPEANKPFLRRIKKKFIGPSINGRQDELTSLFSTNINDTCRFHFFPSGITETKKPNYNDTVKRAELPTFEYINTNPRVLTMKLLFNDIESGIGIVHVPTLKNTLAERAAGGTSGTTGVVPDLSSPLSGGIINTVNRMSTAHCLDVLESWTLPTDESAISGDPTPPHLELVGIGNEIFECVISRLDVNIFRWRRSDSLPLQAWVTIGLRESFNASFPLKDINYQDRLLGTDFRAAVQDLGSETGIPTVQRLLPGR